MNSFTSLVWIAIFLAFAGAQVHAQPEQAPQGQARALLETMALTELLESVRETSERTFVIDHRVNPRVVTGRVNPASLDYSTLLHILRNNGLAAVRAGELTTIVPAGIVRQFPLPVIEEEDDAIHDEEWVTWMVFVDNVDAETLVPILRPMMPSEGHLAANPPSAGIVIVDRYGNAKRIVALIREFDGATRDQ